MVALMILGAIGGAVLAVVYIGGFDAIIEGVAGSRMPLVVMAAAVGLALLVAVWGVARVAALR